MRHHRDRRRGAQPRSRGVEANAVSAVRLQGRTRDGGVRVARPARLPDAHGEIDAELTDPREQLDAFFVQLEPILGSPDFRGCPFTNAASELPDPNHPAHAVVRRHKERLRRWLRERAKAAGARDPGTLSRQLMLVFAGAQAEALIEQSGRPARDAQRLAAKLIEAAID